MIIMVVVKFYIADIGIIMHIFIKIIMCASVHPVMQYAINYV